MGDLAEDFRARREYKVEKRHNNTVTSTQILVNRNIYFESKNSGAHLIVENKFDFWPSTGLFQDRKTKRKGRGVFNLIKRLQPKKEKEDD